MLYLIACKQFNKKVIANGLFEHIGSRLESVIENNLLDYDNLVVVIYNAHLTKTFMKYLVEEI
jgi:hypothetical protein